ncbi:hypothetical protein [Catenovulum adriaticum]|uniref:Ankyrin repeat protein n=1 Tax=Catenovulum adriaticum TaxID=2984846 RepID=A0ABY7AL93_9ALTE|nr:hypothetical protein [Catenovulum sp. TS8]WAJ70325.1 hypothetical protein OLW01_00475 [Catenovulum sp. TS8]
MKLGLFIFFISFFCTGTEINKDPVYASMIKAHLMQGNETEAIKVIPYMKNVNYEYSSHLTLFSLAGNMQANKLVSALLEKGINLEDLNNRAAINSACINSNLSLVQLVIDNGLVADYLITDAGEMPSCMDFSLSSGNDKLFELIMVYGAGQSRDKFCTDSLALKISKIEFQAIFKKACKLRL